MSTEPHGIAVAAPERFGLGIQLMRAKLRRVVSGREGWALLDQGVVSATNFLTNVIVARALGMQGFGVFALAWMAVLFCFNLQIPSITVPLMTILPKLEPEDRRGYLGGVILQEFGLIACSNLALLTCLHFTTMFTHQPGLSALGAPLCLAMSTYLLQDLVRRYLFATRQSRRAFLNDLVSCLPQLPLIYLLLHARLIQVPGVLLTIGLTSIIGIGLGIYWCEPVVFSFSTARSAWQRHWKMSRWMIPSSLLSWISTNFIVLLAPVYYGPVAAGALRASQNIVAVTNVWILGLDNVLVPESSHAYQHGGLPQLRHYLWRAILRWGGLTALFVLVIGLAPGFFLGITYGSQYAAYGSILRMYVIIYLFVFLGAPLRAGLQALEHVSPLLWSQLGGAAFALLCGVPLTRKFGLSGVLIGTLATTVIMQAILLATLLRQLNRKTAMVAAS